MESGKSKITEIWTNSSTPFNPMARSVAGGNVLAGNVQVVAAEVAVSKLIRWLMRMANRPITELIAVHSVSLSMLGGFAGFFKPNTNYSSQASTTQAVQDGAKGIPALFAAQYVVNTASKGLHFPKFTFKDMLITGAAKALTRPILNLAYPNVGKTLQGNFRAHDEMVNKQRVVARFQS